MLKFEDFLVDTVVGFYKYYRDRLDNVTLSDLWCESDFIATTDNI